MNCLRKISKIILNIGNSKYKKTTELTDNEIELLKEKTGLPQDKIIFGYINFMEMYPDGLMDVKEFIKEYRNFYSYGNPDKLAKFAFNAFDTDNCGKISYSEFLITSAFLVDSSKPDYMEKIYDLAFNIYDINRNGKIEKNEALTLLNAIYETKAIQNTQEAKKKVDDLYKIYDKGNKGYLTKKEFINAIESDIHLKEAFLTD